MYAKIFESIYDGSLRKDWRALVTFQQLLVLCDEEGYIDKTSEAISARTTIPLDLIQYGLKELSLPDPDSRSQEEQGRRIVLINPVRTWGWKIVNYASYRDIKSKAELRDYWANQKRSQRQETKAEKITLLKQKLSIAYKRGPNDRWNYEEESMLVEVAKRENCLLEIEELIAFRPTRGKFFPHGIAKLLTGWEATLDAARNTQSQVEDPRFMLKILEDQIECHPANPNWSGHNGPATEAQKIHLKKLRDKSRELKTQFVNAAIR